ncbi:zinc-ribbon domain-containing protein [Patescibacteria group bacterium]|nr:zinc-ribbon domain-containing protein [Patescibacteria group bacterium]
MSESITIKDMQEIAKKKKGKCLSKKYINTHVKLKWQCKKGHKWEATPAHIKSGEWCPKCHNLNRSNLNPAKLNLKEMQEIAKKKTENAFLKNI